MKILPSTESSLKTLRSNPKKEKSKTQGFSFLVQNSEPDEILLDTLFAEPDKVLENIYLLSEEIDKAGEDLAEKPTPEHFARYKKYVGLIVKGALRNMEVKERHVQSFGGTRVYKTVQEIDEVLADLARRILSTEKSRVDLLNLTGHLKGLILSLLA